MAGTDLESGLQFDFSAAVAWLKMDQEGTSPPPGWSRVDYLIEHGDELLLIEVNNSQQAGATEASKKAFADKLLTKELIPGLVCKFRDTYCYLHLMARASRPMVAVFVVVADLDAALLMHFGQRLAERLHQEKGHDPWKVRYAQGCLVLTPQTWASAFPDYPLTEV